MALRSKAWHLPTWAAQRAGRGSVTSLPFHTPTAPSHCLSQSINKSVLSSSSLIHPLCSPSGWLCLPCTQPARGDAQSFRITPSSQKCLQVLRGLETADWTCSIGEVLGGGLAHPQNRARLRSAFRWDAACPKCSVKHQHLQPASSSPFSFFFPS